MKLHHVGMTVNSLRRSNEFYQRYFGFKEEMEFQWGSEKILFLKKEDCRLELIEESGKDSVSKGVFLHLALEVDDLETEIGLLMKEGLSPVEGPLVLENGWKVAFFYGPDGEIIEMVEEDHSR
ncbi:VOC family protein [Bacillus sp. BHET2]|uniref:VOC family protein n=1 Tax=Bacillus sp. BHET2 TaxID=2583818 RepID=UPI00110E254F|nr:VOC family protein [Bacillus sp. BHET2]TMU83954.1 VOC family protein [Bacillus sp. BHET2]